MSESTCFSVFLLDTLFTAKQSLSTRSLSKPWTITGYSERRLGETQTAECVCLLWLIWVEHEGVFQLISPSEHGTNVSQSYQASVLFTAQASTSVNTWDSHFFYYTSWLHQNSFQKVHREKTEWTLHSPKFSQIHKHRQQLNIERFHPSEAKKSVQGLLRWSSG